MEKFDYEKTFMGVGNLSNRQAGKVKVNRLEYRFYNFLQQIKKVEGRIGDVGSGGGEFLEKVKILFPRAECYGCDISKKAISLGAAVSSSGIDLKVIGEGGVLPYADNSFDLCTSFNVLEHVPDIEANLKEIHRILKNGGRFHVCVPCEGEPFTMTWFYQKTNWSRNFTYKNWGHIQPELTHKKMLSYLTAAGFKVTAITYSLHLPVDFLNLFLYFLPKEFLNIFLPQKAFQYTDAGVNQSKFEKKEKKGWLSLFRQFWLVVLRVYEFLRSLDAILFKKIAFSASTMHITCSK